MAHPLFTAIVLSLTAFLVLILIAAIFKTAVVVPQQTVYIVERLGRYHRALEAGFHLLIPFVDRVAYRISLKEEPIHVQRQTCITKDNVALEVDGILYLKVFDPIKAAYGVSSYRYAAIQLAQTSLRSAIGKIDLDRTFEEREHLNAEVVAAVDEAAQNWGVKVLRYEIRDIHPPKEILRAMEKQMKAEREKRAMILQSEGERQAKINLAEATRRQAELESEGEKIRRINEAEGRAQEILKVARATAEGIRMVAESINLPGGYEAATLEVAKKWVQEFGRFARETNTLIVSRDVADVAGIVTSIMQSLRGLNRTSRTGSEKAPAPDYEKKTS